MSLAENQRPACEALAAEHLIVYLGHTETVTVERLCPILSALLDDPEQRQRLAMAGTALVDGQGVQRVIEALRAVDKLGGKM